MDSQEELKVLAQKNTLKALSLLRQYGVTFFSSSLLLSSLELSDTTI